MPHPASRNFFRKQISTASRNRKTGPKFCSQVADIFSAERALPLSLLPWTNTSGILNSPLPSLVLIQTLRASKLSRYPSRTHMDISKLESSAMVGDCGIPGSIEIFLLPDVLPFARRGTMHWRWRLVHIKRPILRIPNLAIHLQRSVNSEGFKVHRETHTTPIMATELAAALNAPKSSDSSKSSAEDENKASGSAESRHGSLLLEILASELDVQASEIVDLDLCVTDTQPASIGGGLNEFVFAPRLDNLASCFTATRALINCLEDSAAEQSVELGSIVKMIALFDHEEVGSESSRGAGSPMMEDAIRRITALCDGACYHRVIRGSMLVSADMAHALHPNYMCAHESKHRPQMGAGLVVKTNQNQRYATSGVTGLIMREAARRAGNLPIQEFVVPNDKPCGSTIGPILSSNTGLRTVDVGQAQLSMHSVREMCSAADFDTTEQMFRAFFTHFKVIDAELSESAE